ncbi:HAMP domain-containing sensor histidine kinase [Bacteriovorax sp. Seq25_V]|uniref:sensor histidine kinase n=1 Tax=Bacteriovorax sp. Seq25_V TaxID=1201288 RepID=UPI00038A093B|nr:HAMP domain-containing sensor histidine kinase [Bacteriovorax sp. Seq25_V]EQC46160.1 GHKL domain protein [Bacteriovorax sp. Seq25_V]
MEVLNINYVCMINTLKSLGLSVDLLFEGTTITYEQAAKTNARSSWSDYNIALQNVFRIIGDDYSLISKFAVNSREYSTLQGLFSGIVSYRFLYWCQANFIGNYLFKNIKYTYANDSIGNVVLTMKVCGNAPTLGFFDVYAEVFKIFPTQLGGGDSLVQTEMLSESEVRYIITPPTSLKLSSIFKSFLKLPFGFIRATKLLSHTYSELLLIEEQKAELERLYDIQANLNEEVKLKNSQLEEQKEKVTVLLKVLSHDISNPLLVIDGRVNQIMRRKNLNVEQVLSSLEKISNSSKRISNMIEETRIFISSENSEVKLENVSLNQAIKYSVEQMNLIAVEKGVNLKYVEQPDFDIFVKASNEFLSASVLNNFISNAIKFTPVGGEVRLSLNTLNDNKVAVFEIQDTGVGMSEECLAEVKKSGKLSTTPGTEGEKGTGYGLSIASNFLSRFNAEYDVFSELNKGTTFRLSFPIVSTRIKRQAFL